MDKFPVLSIYQFDDDGKEHEFHINTFSEHLLKHHTNVLIPHKHDFYLTVLFTKGSGWHEIDFKRHAVAPGSLFFLHPGQTHHWEFTPDVEGVIFFHSLTFFQLNCPQQALGEFPFYSTRQQEQMLQLDRERSVHFEQRLTGILEEYQSRQLFRYSKISSLVNTFYIDVARTWPAGLFRHGTEPSGYVQRFRQFEALIEEHFRSEKSASAYAERMNISAKHLNRISKECCGLTSTEVITERVLLEAKRLLSHQEFNLNEIAFTLGFEEYAYFSRLFKKHTGETPHEFRKKYRAG